MPTLIESKHPDYQDNVDLWEFYLRSYMGGEHYKGGQYLTKYSNESSDEYLRRLDLTPIDNHCQSVIHIYSSFLWRIPPTRNFGSLDGSDALMQFMKDADLEGRSFNGFMAQAQVWSSVYGHVWLMIDKPKSNAGTRAEELDQGIRPYVTLYTPENVFDWKWERTASGRQKLVYFKVRESVVRDTPTDSTVYYREWTEETVKLYEVSGKTEKLIEEMDNPIGAIPAVFLPAKQSTVRGIGISDLSDIAYMQRTIYQELSEVEQLIRISNHPTLVKSFDTDASAGAGAIINMPDELDGSLKPYQLQPSGQNLDALRASIADKVTAINRMAHLGAIRGTDAVKASGIALQSEFQMLNASLKEKANSLQLAEEQLWALFCIWQDVAPDVEVGYPDSFDLRDYENELQFLQQARASGVQSTTFLREIDKQIADLVLDDEQLEQAHDEIDQGRRALGSFETE
jgi:hypothetical protein